MCPSACVQVTPCTPRRLLYITHNALHFWQWWPNQSLIDQTPHSVASHMFCKVITCRWIQDWAVVCFTTSEPAGLLLFFFFFLTFFKEWIKHHFVFLPQINVSIFSPRMSESSPKVFHWTLAAKQNGPWGRQRRRKRRRRRAVVLQSTLKFSSCTPRTIGRVGMRAEKCCNGGGCCGVFPWKWNNARGA